jgi:hypothetical protein
VADRVPVFELHILPMFRLLDHDHMAAKFDLFDLEAVWKRRAAILAHLKANPPLMMPTKATAGPWPSEWIALFERWIATGTETQVGHHLELLAPDSGQYELVPSFGDKLDVIATVTTPSPGYQLWFELRRVSATEREYALYGEPPHPAQPANPTVAKAAEKFKKTGLQRIFVIDARGRQQIDLATA